MIETIVFYSLVKIDYKYVAEDIIFKSSLKIWV